MKLGHIIIFGIVFWMISSYASETYWVYKYNLTLFASLIILISCFLWITMAKNRKMLSRSSDEFAPSFLSSVLTALIAIFAIGIVLFQGANIYIKSSAGYHLIETSIKSDSSILSEAGTIKGIRIKSYSQTKNNSISNYGYSLNVFGTTRTLKVDAIVRKEPDSLVIEKLIIVN